jgi:hypothetical protein
MYPKYSYNTPYCTSKGYVYGIWMQLMEHMNIFLDENNLKSYPNEKMNMSIVAW